MFLTDIDGFLPEESSILRPGLRLFDRVDQAKETEVVRVIRVVLVDLAHSPGSVQPVYFGGVVVQDPVPGPAQTAEARTIPVTRNPFDDRDRARFGFDLSWYASRSTPEYNYLARLLLASSSYLVAGSGGCGWVGEEVVDEEVGVQ